MFYVGQKVVCINATHRTLKLEKGRVYEILEIRKCKCGLLFDIGICGAGRGTFCYVCETDIANGNQSFFGEKRFALIQEKRNHNKIKIAEGLKLPQRVIEKIDSPVTKPIECQK